MFKFLLWIVLGAATFLFGKFVLIYNRVWSVDEFKFDVLLELFLFVGVLIFWPLAIAVLFCYLILIGLNKIITMIFSELEDKK